MKEGVKGVVSYGLPAFGSIVGALSTPVHPVFGAAAGGSVGSGISKLLGFGDYKVTTNSLVPLPMGAPVPSFGDISNATRVKHREYIADVTAVGGTAFTLTSYAINAALASTFPWLVYL